MKRFVSILTIITLVLSFCVQTASAESLDDVTGEANIVLSSVLTDSLRECIAQVADDDVIKVTIELKDNLDLDNVEQTAVLRAGISSTEIAALSVNALSLSETENESLQLVALKAVDRVSNERNSILKNHYSVSNADFISSVGLSNSQIGSVGIFTPFIREVSISKKRF